METLKLLQFYSSREMSTWNYELVSWINLPSWNSLKANKKYEGLSVEFLFKGVLPSPGMLYLSSDEKYLERT